MRKIIKKFVENVIGTIVVTILAFFLLHLVSCSPLKKLDISKDFYKYETVDSSSVLKEVITKDIYSIEKLSSGRNVTIYVYDTSLPIVEETFKPPLKAEYHIIDTLVEEIEYVIDSVYIKESVDSISSVSIESGSETKYIERERIDCYCVVLLVFGFVICFFIIKILISQG